ncbi:MAG: hypothetical protein OXC82_13415, partial [Rhodobacteraceae bacterium]|nr:hypothetical protein [Paracoccaceae bacterium]
LKIWRKAREINRIDINLLWNGQKQCKQKRERHSFGFQYGKAPFSQLINQELMRLSTMVL